MFVVRKSISPAISALLGPVGVGGVVIITGVVVVTAVMVVITGLVIISEFAFNCACNLESRLYCADI